MTVMDVWIVRVRMNKRLVLVDMAVGFGQINPRLVLVMMMSVVNMQVLMFHRLVFMPMLVPFSQMQPDADAHQGRRSNEPPIERLSEKDNGDNRANERSSREIRSGAGRSDVAQS